MDTPPDNSRREGAGAGAQPPQAAGAEPPSPRTVIRGESSWIGHDPDTGERRLVVPVSKKYVRFVPLPAEGAHPYAAITDWLNFTFPLGRYLENPRGFFSHLFEVIGKELAPAVERGFGKYNYDRTFALGETKALFALGGNNGTALLSLPGEICALVKDWSHVVAWGRDELRGHITRWDGAVDDYLGMHTVDEAVVLYEQGLFGGGGNLPKMTQGGNWIAPDGRGRTLNIGDRKHGKRLCIYEKGMQLGCKWHPWTRWELTLGNRDRDIPWEVLLTPGRYVAGAYPKALAWVDKEMVRVKTLQKQTQIGYDAAVHYGRNQIGNLLNLMLKVEGSPENAVAKLIREGVPRRVLHPAVKDPEAWIE